MAKKPTPKTPDDLPGGWNLEAITGLVSKSLAVEVKARIDKHLDAIRLQEALGVADRQIKVLEMDWSELRDTIQDLSDKISDDSRSRWVLAIAKNALEAMSISIGQLPGILHLLKPFDPNEEE